MQHIFFNMLTTFCVWECQNKISTIINYDIYYVDFSKCSLVYSLFSSPNNYVLHLFMFYSKKVIPYFLWKLEFGAPVACTNFCLGKQWKASDCNFHCIAGCIIRGPIFLPGYANFHYFWYKRKLFIVFGIGSAKQLAGI